ncbi:GAF domain-containing protein [Tumebacillus sp. ITR2]|uniref:histidine kinase n=1 Tax=Tumebacillus amylolyticus TaxID=2801339 RepID=A0ABS1J4J1_9BACL|nr:GAF domain-containing sensor histidine kinase [Tumebacillus amylolyticus]MBL0385194.1 GAF domain-containing protein [Tumebacillus amylolyticus]
MDQQSRIGRLVKLTELIHKNQDVMALLDHVATAIQAEIVRVDVVGIYLPQSNGRYSCVCGKPEVVNGVSLVTLIVDPEKDQFVREIIESKRGIYVSNALDDRRLDPDKVKRLDIDSVLGLPIVYEDEVYGLMFMQNVGAKLHLTESDIQLVETFANMAAVALHNAKLISSQQALLFEKELLLDATRSLSYCSSFDEVVETSVRFLREALGMEKIGLQLYNPSQKKFRSLKTCCPIEELQQLILDDVKHPVFLGDPGGERGTLLLPLIATGDFLGAFAVCEYEEAQFTLQGSTHLAQSLADVTATALANLMRMEQLESQAIAERQQSEELLQKKDKLALVGQLAAGVAHEIRNPLASITGFVQLMQEGVINSRYLEIMKSELDRIELIISEFLVLAKPQAVRFAPCDLSQLLQNVVVLIESQATLNNVRIVTDLSPNLPRILGKENQLKQLFINIFKNAIEAMTHAPDAVLHIGVQPSERQDALSIHITDNGCGISPDRLAKLGEPFYTTKEKGTGLGMMVSYKIVADHQGNIEIFSEQGQGTRVTVTFPCQ